LVVFRKTRYLSRQNSNKVHERINLTFHETRLNFAMTNIALFCSMLPNSFTTEVKSSQEDKSSINWIILWFKVKVRLIELYYGLAHEKKFTMEAGIYIHYVENLWITDSVV